MEQFHIGEDVVVKAKTTAHPGALYDCRIIDVTAHNIIVSGYVRQNTMDEPRISNQRQPVTYGIKKVDLEIGEAMIARK